MPAPKGNDFAVGNSGGGPPDGNSNAVKHGGWSDPAKHYQRLDADEREAVAYWLRNEADYFPRVHGIPPSAADATALGIGASTLDGLDVLSEYVERERGSYRSRSANGGATANRLLSGGGFGGE